MLFDARRNYLAVDDDSGERRDPKLQFKIPSNGVFFPTVNDAHDRGGEFHDYFLRIELE